MKILQINTTVNSGSHGRIAEEIGSCAISAGHTSYIAAAYTDRPSSSNVIKIGSDLDRKKHGLKTRLFDRHGFGSLKATKELIKKIEVLNPDLIHLHNIHGYYLNVRILFEYIRRLEIPVIWTLHDCWSFTGHCAHYQYVMCDKWKTQCSSCPNVHGYPASWLIDNSHANYLRKRELFRGIKNLTLVVPSEWLQKQLPDSFLKDYPVRLIYNGINTELFTPSDKSTVRKGTGARKMILGVSNIWNQKKGLEDFFRLRRIVEKDIDIVLVGLKRSQLKELPDGIRGIERTESISHLVEIYSAADVFVNPTYVDNFPSTNIESLSCGTPVITYNTGGSPEAIDSYTGIVVEKGNIKGLADAINEIIDSKDRYTKEMCRNRALMEFSATDRFGDYLRLYYEVMQK